MPDIVLFRIRNQSIISLAGVYHLLLLFSFALFLISGNFFRLFPLYPFPSHLSVVEVALYSLAFPLYFSKLRKSHILALCIIASTLYGSMLHGLHLASVLYSFKLIAMIAAGVAIGESLFRKFGAEIEQCLGYLVRIFVVILFIGIAIFIVFPKAHYFFQFLQNYGIHFTGDPHQRRFISPFFDPNYYSAIACIPLILTWFLGKRITFSLIFMSILLSFSRSGIATAALILILMGVFHWIHQRRPRWGQLFLGITLVAALAAVLAIYSNEFNYFVDRLLHISQDNSAHARLLTFQKGAQFFWHYPFFGVGYNYLSQLLQNEMGILSLDSSLLSTLVNFGLIPCLAFLLWGVYWSVNSFKQKSHPVFSWLYIYLLICIFFTSQFNNLLYYQYWMIPMIALFTYLQRSRDESRICP